MGIWLGRGVEGAGGVRGLGPRKKILKISIENLHFKVHVYAVFMYFFKHYFTLYHS
jgi:hypothetical protein